MAVRLSIRKVPNRVVAELKRRARANHRSLQGELLALVEAAAERGTLSIEEIRRRVGRLGIHSPSESLAMIRSGRDA
jgi:antitoxin FitA